MENNFERFLFCWVKLFESIIGIIMLGSYSPTWSLNFIRFCVIRRSKHDL